VALDIKSRQQGTSAPADTVEGFSERFNQLLDLAGFQQTGRITHVAKFFNVSVSGARRWCKLNKPPRIRDLTTVVETLVAQTEHEIDTVALCNWLLYQTDNPLQTFHQGTASLLHSSSANASAQINALGNHVLMGQVYMTMNAAAQNLSLDLYNNPDMPNNVMDQVIKRLVDYALKTELPEDSLAQNEDFQALAASLLHVAKDSYF